VQLTPIRSVQLACRYFRTIVDIPRERVIGFSLNFGTGRCDKFTRIFLNIVQIFSKQIFSISVSKRNTVNRCK